MLGRRIGVVPVRTGAGRDGAPGVRRREDQGRQVCGDATHARWREQDSGSAPSWWAHPEQPRGVNAVLGAPVMAYVVKADPAYDVLTFNPERDMGALTGGLAGERLHQLKTDIAAFVNRGGKLLLWHGFNNPGPSPLSTIACFSKACSAKVPAAKDAVRLFLAPGVLHCGGGAGPDRFDALSALETWVEQGTSPASMLATRAGSRLSRPLCPYPQLPSYTGAGDTNDAANYTCAVR